ncbi:MAG TPA: hypothetical protein VN493_25455 [Thermoanaerobaculia bacterium]|nr:hypothetical protein [Thermoanaerobaculia bacterium]
MPTSRLGIAGLVVLALAIPAAGLVPLPITARWYLTIALIVAFLMLIGKLRNDRLGGFLIDNRKKVSLSRLQLVGWTVLILSAFSTAAFWNILHGVKDPLSIVVPEHVWALMGISVTSFVGSRVVKSSKRATGHLAENVTPMAARTTDIFKEEDEGTEETVDLGKVQMFLFTLIVFAAYAVALGTLLLDHESKRSVIQAFPELSEGMLALLGLSHTGYLANKAVPARTDERLAGSRGVNTNVGQ